MPSEILRWLAICGLGVPISHLLIPLVLGLLAPNYSSMRQYLSELTSIRSYAVIVNLLFSVAGLLTIAFSIALYHGIPRNCRLVDHASVVSSFGCIQRRGRYLSR